jgi:hypothetical protein
MAKAREDESLRTALAFRKLFVTDPDGPFVLNKLVIMALQVSDPTVRVGRSDVILYIQREIARAGEKPNPQEDSENE